MKRSASAEGYQVSELIGRLLVVAGLVTAGILFTAAPAWAQNAHFVTGPTAGCDGTCLDVDFKVAGLGNVRTTNYSLSCTNIAVTGQCYTKNGNPVEGTTKSGTASASASGSLPVRNGTTSGPITVCPVVQSLNFSPGCTGNQSFVITSADYSGCTLAVDGISDNNLSASCP